MGTRLLSGLPEPAPGFCASFPRPLGELGLCRSEPVESPLILDRPKKGLARARPFSEMDAAIQQYGSVFPIGHTECAGAGGAAKHDLARRCPPRQRMSLPPAEPAPVGTRIERRPAIVADPRNTAKCSRTVRCHPEPSVIFRVPCKTRAYCSAESGNNAAATWRSSATRTL